MGQRPPLNGGGVVQARRTAISTDTVANSTFSAGPPPLWVGGRTHGASEMTFRHEKTGTHRASPPFVPGSEGRARHQNPRIFFLNGPPAPPVPAWPIRPRELLRVHVIEEWHTAFWDLHSVVCPALSPTLPPRPLRRSPFCASQWRNVLGKMSSWPDLLRKTGLQIGLLQRIYTPNYGQALSANPSSSSLRLPHVFVPHREHRRPHRRRSISERIVHHERLPGVP
ncbi:hypothetical protein C8Q79DRAFT_255661 [Trametes meyenii]|nr:hypothetical protein C8Q79DRAFT_255661 [Trametes meyenii]